MKLNLVRMDAPLRDGDAVMFERADGAFGLIYFCPGCKAPRVAKANFNPLTNSLAKSIVCGNCGWHATLTAGIFTKC